MELEQGRRIENEEFWYDPEAWHRAGFVQKDLKEIEPWELMAAIKKQHGNMAPGICLAAWYCLSYNGFQGLAKRFGQLMLEQWPDNGGFEHVVDVPPVTVSCFSL